MKNSKEFEKKLRSAGLRPTKQRLSICNVLYNRKDTFHFSIEELTKIIEKNVNSRISLATIYNTINAFKKKVTLRKFQLIVIKVTLTLISQIIIIFLMKTQKSL